MPTEAPPFPFALYAVTCGGVCVWFFLAWLWARAKDNWSLVDVAWVISVPLAGLVPTAAVAGFGTRAGVMFILTCVWGLRLASHLFGRVHGKEDPRYAEMRERWGAKTPAMMAGFYQLQALVVWVLLLPLFLVSRDDSPYPAAVETAGLLLVLAGISGEAVADRQLKDFVRTKKHRDAICDRGLWRYSRHPNYFFESVTWLGFGLAAVGSPSGYLALLAPALMVWLLVGVTGVKLSEERYDRTKGEEWREYKRRVSVFVPWFRKRS